MSSTCRKLIINISKFEKYDTCVLAQYYIFIIFLDNQLCEEEGTILGKALLLNSTLSSLILRCMKRVLYLYLLNLFIFADNQIRDVGSQAIGQALVLNSSLTVLDLEGSLAGW